MAVNLWNEAMPAGYFLDERLWRQNVDHSEHLCAEASLAAFEGNRLIGIVISKRPHNISAIFTDPSHQRQGVGAKLLSAATNALKASSSDISQIVTGQDYAHFFPGVPDAFTEARSFFEALGWARSGGWCVDLRRALIDYKISDDVENRIKSLFNQGIEIRSCLPRDVDALLDHVRENFSQRWWFETKQRIEMEPSPSEIKIAVQAEKVIGFAQTFTSNSVKLGPSVYWRSELGELYGGLGPIGVAKDVRKIGLGLALLSYSIQEVKNAGMQQMAIDWTVLIDFYAKVGFSQWRRFTPYTKQLDSSVISNPRQS